MSGTRYTVLVHPDHESGGFYATVPAIPGVVDQGETVEETLNNVREALTFTLEAMIEDGEEIPSDVEVKETHTLDLNQERTAAS